jgi:hypothetical protein
MVIVRYHRLTGVPIIAKIYAMLSTHTELVFLAETLGELHL